MLRKFIHLPAHVKEYVCGRSTRFKLDSAWAAEIVALVGIKLRRSGLAPYVVPAHSPGSKPFYVFRLSVGQRHKIRYVLSDGCVYGDVRGEREMTARSYRQKGPWQITWYETARLLDQNAKAVIKAACTHDVGWRLAHEGAIHHTGTE